MRARFLAVLFLWIRGQEAPVLVPESDGVSLTRGATLKSFHLKSLILNEKRPIHLVLPTSYARSAPERRYPVILVLDGEDNAPSAASVCTELSRHGQIPESIVVAIPNTDRLRDLTPPGISVSGSSRHEGGDRFLDFVEQELLPAIDLQFRGGMPRVFIGHSSGGILATYLAATRDTFRAVVAIDTPTHLDDDWLPKQLIARAKDSAAPLRYVSYEARFGWSEDAWKALVQAAPSTWRLHREKLANESHESMGMLAMYLGLREVFRDYSMRSAPTAPTASILPYYEKISADWGETLFPPKPLLRNVLEDLLAEGQGLLARGTFESLAFGYGSPSDSVELLARIGEVERLPPPEETVEGLLATPFPTPEEAEEFLGEWIGDEWMNPDEERNNNVTLRLRVENDRLVGDTVYRVTSRENLVMRWEYLQITPSGMSWGYMNGMRPRGVLLFEANLEDDQLTGQMRMAGIRFVRPDGSRPEPVHFSFQRAEK